MKLEWNGRSFDVIATEGESGRFHVSVDGESMEVEARSPAPGVILGEMGGERWVVRVHRDGEAIEVIVGGARFRFEETVERRRAAGSGGIGPESDGTLTPPTPGVVVKIAVEPGAIVEPGDPVIVISAMKMESTLGAPIGGRVTEIRVSEGDQVMPGDTLARIEPLPEDGGDRG